MYIYRFASESQSSIPLLISSLSLSSRDIYRLHHESNKRVYILRLKITIYAIDNIDSVQGCVYLRVLLIPPLFQHWREIDTCSNVRKKNDDFSAKSRVSGAHRTCYDAIFYDNSQTHAFRLSRLPCVCESITIYYVSRTDFGLYICEAEMSRWTISWCFSIYMLQNEFCSYMDYYGNAFVWKSSDLFFHRASFAFD